MPSISAIFDTSALTVLLDENDNRIEATKNCFVRYKTTGIVFITDVIFSEISVSLGSLKATQTACEMLGILRLGASDDALFLAGQAFHKYKGDNKGPKTGVLPDFLIGAVSETEGLDLVTFNAKDFKRYFPGLHVVEP